MNSASDVPSKISYHERSVRYKSYVKAINSWDLLALTVDVGWSHRLT
jgi:hypothetical protein